MRLNILMKKLFFPKPDKVLGIDIGPDRIKIVQMNMKAGKKPEVTDYVLQDLPQELKGTGLFAAPTGLSEFLGEIINKHGFNAKACVFTLGGRSTFVRGITMPPMSNAELAEAVMWDSSQYVPYENDTYYIDFDKYGDLDKEGQQPVVLVAAPKEVIDILVAAGEALQLNVLKIDIDVLAVDRALGPAYTDFVLLNIVRNYSMMTIFQKGAPVAQRSIPTSAMSFATIIAEKMNVSISEGMDIMQTENLLTTDAPENSIVREALKNEINEVVKECRRTVDYFVLNKKDATFTSMVLSGGGAVLKGMDVYMDTLMDIKVEQFDVLKTVNFDSRFEKKKVESNAPSLVIAIGAALAGGEDND